MANWYVSSVAYTAVTQFAISHAYVIGDIVRQLAAPSVGNERCFRCTTSGTSGGSESAWTLTKAATTTQGTAVFTEVTGNETYQSPGAWAAPIARVQSFSTWAVSGDTIYIAADHAETQAASMSIAAGVGPGTFVIFICVDSTGTGHVPPQAGDTRTTATISTTGANNMAVGTGGGYWYGITFSAGSGSSTATLTCGSASFTYWNKFDNCAFKLNSTSVSCTIITGGAANGYVEWNNCQVTLGAGAQQISANKGTFIWRNTASAVLSTAQTSSLIQDGSLSSNGNMTLFLDGLDFSNLAHNRILGPVNSGTVAVMTNCKINAATAISTVASAAGSGRADAIGCDSGGNAYRSERYMVQGSLTTDTAVVHTGGASDGTTAISWKIVSTASAAWTYVFEAFSIAIWNSSTGSAKTVSFEVVANASALLTNIQLWMDVAYLGTSSSTCSTIGTTTRANILAAATNLTASSVAWDSAATARANAHAYSLGDVIKLASNTGRVFFCTTAGTSAGSEPGGYASAVDGGSVTDNGAVFRAGMRMTVSLSITPQVAGLIRVTPKVGVVSTTLYIDPLLTVA